MSILPVGLVCANAAALVGLAILPAPVCAAASEPPLVGPLVPFPADDVVDQISDYVREVFQDRGGTCWFGTNGDGLARWDGRALAYLSVEDGLAGDAIRGIAQDAAGALWFATNGGVSRLRDGRFTNFTVAEGLASDEVWSLHCDAAGTVWAGTLEGVCRLERGAERFAPFALPRVKVEGATPRFGPKVVFAIAEDAAGALWFGTDGEGVHRWDGSAFTSWTTADGLAGDLVRALRPDRGGGIWIGTDGGGASRFDGRTFRNVTGADGLSNDRVWEILETRDGSVWFSTLGAGACRWDGAAFTAFPPDPDLLIHGRPARSHVQEFFEDRDGVLWLGCSGGLFRFDGTGFVNVGRSGPWPARPASGVPAG